jgi:hypothetical protein
LIVLMLDGWEQSRGVNAEIALARELGLPVEYVNPAELLAAPPESSPV